MKKSLLVLIIAGFTGSLIASATLAQEPAGKQGQRQRGADPAARFAAMDTDGNGSISLEEFKVMEKKRAEQMKERMGDRYDPERAAKRPSAEEAFKKMDKDADGKLTKEEMAAAREVMRARRGGAAGGEGGGPRGPRGGGGAGGGASE